MATINVYEQYFKASCIVNEVERRAVSVMLISTSEEGRIKYEVAISFFPHRDEEDYAISYDGYLARTVYEAPGRRSKKREKELMENFRVEADLLAAEMKGEIYWNTPLIEARHG